MAADLTTEAPFDPGHVGHMIEVPVSQQEQLRRDVSRLEPGACAVRGIEQDCAAGCLEQVAVCLENAATKCLVFHRQLIALLGLAHKAGWSVIIVPSQE